MATEEALLSFLPPALYQGKIVVEVGERVTAALAEKAAKLVLVPHLDSQHDLTESVDLIFSSSSEFVDLSDEQVAELAKKLLEWVKLGGYIFFTELCSHQFREPRFYTKVFRECRHISDVSGKSFQFSLVASKCVAASKDENQICWIWQKLNSDDDEEFQQFLDNVQYKSNDILRYERIFGPGMCCIGGLDTNTEFVSMLDLKAGQKVLDVGCGIGGAAFYMSENFDVNVVGIDYSENMISFALERALGLKCLVEFEVVDCTKKSYPDNTFDVIYSRDSISLIQDKPALFRNFYKWLKPCGKVLVSDYCRKAGTLSQHTQEYIKKRRYDLHDIDTYGQMLKDAGFEEVKTEDRTKQFTAILTKEVKRLENEKEEFMGDLSEEEYIDFVDGWKSKLSRTVSGEQTWGLFFAKKK